MFQPSAMGCAAVKDRHTAAGRALVLGAGAFVRVLAVDELIVAGAAHAVVKGSLPVEAVVAPAAEERIGAVVAGKDVLAGRALDLLDAAVNLAGVAAADIGVENRAVDRCLDEDT